MVGLEGIGEGEGEVEGWRRAVGGRAPTTSASHVTQSTVHAALGFVFAGRTIEQVLLFLCFCHFKGYVMSSTNCIFCSI